MSTIYHDPAYDRSGCNHPKAVGDIVQFGRNLGPRNKILAIFGEKAWVRCLSWGVDHVVPLERLRLSSDPST